MNAREIYNEVINTPLFKNRVEFDVARINKLAEFASDNKEQYIKQAMLKLKETMKDGYLFRSWANYAFSYDLFNDSNFFVYLDEEVLNYDDPIEQVVFEKGLRRDLWNFLVPYCVSEHFYRYNQVNTAEKRTSDYTDQEITEMHDKLVERGYINPNIEAFTALCYNKEIADTNHIEWIKITERNKKPNLTALRVFITLLFHLDDTAKTEGRTRIKQIATHYFGVTFVASIFQNTTKRYEELASIVKPSN